MCLTEPMIILFFFPRVMAGQKWLLIKLNIVHKYLMNTFTKCSIKIIITKYFATSSYNTSCPMSTLCINNGNSTYNDSQKIILYFSLINKTGQML